MFSAPFLSPLLLQHCYRSCIYTIRVSESALCKGLVVISCHRNITAPRQHFLWAVANIESYMTFIHLNTVLSGRSETAPGVLSLACLACSKISYYGDWHSRSFFLFFFFFSWRQCKLLDAADTILCQGSLVRSSHVRASLYQVETPSFSPEWLLTHCNKTGWRKNDLVTNLPCTTNYWFNDHFSQHFWVSYKWVWL